MQTSFGNNSKQITIFSFAKTKNSVDANNYLEDAN